jgi:hypothetical protein
MVTNRERDQAAWPYRRHRLVAVWITILLSAANAVGLPDEGLGVPLL